LGEHLVGTAPGGWKKALGLEIPKTRGIQSWVMMVPSLGRAFLFFSSFLFLFFSFASWFVGFRTHGE